MEQFEKVCKGLECCLNTGEFDECTENCPYFTKELGVGVCSENIMRDAIALIRQQQERIKELEATQTARVMTQEEVKALKWDYCYLEAEHRPYSKERDALCGTYTLNCAMWGNVTAARIDYGDDSYGKTWRCWTQRPTDEQREAEPWKA